MTVDATGVDRDGRPARAVWSLVAEAGDGPSVPTLPALAIVRAMLDGRPPAGPGARSAAGLIDLADFEREAERLAISTRIARSSPGAEPLFRTALGAAFDDLPPVVREAHDPRPTIYLEGVADIHGPQGALAALIGRAIGFPRGLRSAPARVRIERMGGGERWTRRFAGSTFSSRLSPGSAPGTLIERFGPFSFDLAIAAEAGGFTLGGRGVALPRNGVATAARALDGRAGLRDARWRIRLQRPHRRAVRRPHRALRGPA